MTERLAKELEILRAVFPDSEFHDTDSGWIRIPRYTVQHGGWTQSEVAVCFQVPSGYPGNPPYAFWVSPLLRLAASNGPPSNNYQEPSPRRFPATGKSSPGLTSTPGVPRPSRWPALISSISFCRSVTGSGRGRDVKITLDLSGGFKKRLWAHLLQNELEQVAFVFADVIAGDHSTVFTPQGTYLAPPGHFAFQSGYHIELVDDVRPELIKRAWDTNTSLVEFHSHPADRLPAIFSGSDLSGFDEFIPHCRWRLRGRPYLAVLVNKLSVDALAWAGESKSPVALNSIRLGWFRKIVPTGRTVASLRTCGVKHGPGTV